MSAVTNVIEWTHCLCIRILSALRTAREGWLFSPSIGEFFGVIWSSHTKCSEVGLTSRQKNSLGRHPNVTSVGMTSYYVNAASSEQGEELPSLLDYLRSEIHHSLKSSMLKHWIYSNACWTIAGPSFSLTSCESTLRKLSYTGAPVVGPPPPWRICQRYAKNYLKYWLLYSPDPLYGPRRDRAVTRPMKLTWFDFIWQCHFSWFTFTEGDCHTFEILIRLPPDKL